MWGSITSRMSSTSSRTPRSTLPRRRTKDFGTRSDCAPPSGSVLCVRFFLRLLPTYGIMYICNAVCSTRVGGTFSYRTKQIPFSIILLVLLYCYCPVSSLYFAAALPVLLLHADIGICSSPPRDHAYLFGFPPRITPLMQTHLTALSKRNSKLYFGTQMILQVSS